jgi:magnesium transporter
MVKIYYRENEKVIELDKPVKDCWINIFPPFNMEKLEDLSQQLDIPFSFIVDCIDLYERSRYEKEDDNKLIVINTPIVNEGLDIEDDATYITVPVGIILKPDMILTISSLSNPMIEWFEKNPIKNLRPDDREMFILKIFERNVAYYLHYLRETNKRISLLEKELDQSGRNLELKKLLNIQKSLVYFVNDLRANEMVFLKIQRTDFLGLHGNETARDFLQDIMIDNSQAMEMANVYSNILASTMEAFANIISNNLNQVMRRLTSVTLILMFPTLVASIYGMNVHLPFQESKYAFFYTIAFAFFVAFMISYYLAKKKWM